MTPTISRKQVITGIVVFLALIVAYFIIVNLPRAQATLTVTSGTPTPTPAATPSSDRPIFSGMDALVDRGLSADQLENVKYALYSYSQSAKLYAGTVSADPNSIKKQFTSDSTTLSFAVDFDKTAYTATVTYSDFESVDIKLTNQSGVQVYDSGVITGQKL